MDYTNWVIWWKLGRSKPALSGLFPLDTFVSHSGRQLAEFLLIDQELFEFSRAVQTQPGDARSQRTGMRIVVAPTCGRLNDFSGLRSYQLA